MSTRAMYSFIDKGETVHVYKHHDGYPEGAAVAINNAILFAWQLPRFEANEFAAAFVAINKMPYYLQDPIIEFLEKLHSLPEPEEYTTTLQMPVEVMSLYLGENGKGSAGGGVRLVNNYTVYADIEYRYEIRYNGGLWITAYETNYWRELKEKIFFDGYFEDFKAKYLRKEKEENVELPL